MNKENRTNRNEEYPRKQTNSNNKEEFSKEELSSSGEIKEGLENASSDESSKPSIQNNVPTFQGYLIKKGAVRRNWKRRWFVLQDGKMIYYSGQDKKKKKGEFVIRGMLCGKMVSASKQYQYAFQIETKKRIWYLRAESVELFKDWMKKLELHGVKWDNRRSKVLDDGTIINHHFLQISPSLAPGWASLESEILKIIFQYLTLKGGNWFRVMLTCKGWYVAGRQAFQPPFYEASVSFEHNPSYRRTMEDKHVIISKLGGDPTLSFFAVYDGHGGSTVSELLASHLHTTIFKHIYSGSEIKKAIYDSFLEVDKKFEGLPEVFKTLVGSTAITALIKYENTGKKLYISNAGDSRAVICRKGVAERLSIDHKGNLESEETRIRNLEGWVVRGKVAGILSVSRSFGDVDLKKWVIAEPHIREIDLTSDDNLLILACDGLWDVVQDQEAINLIYNQHLSAKEMAQLLVQTAIKKGTTDNVSVIVVELHP